MIRRSSPVIHQGSSTPQILQNSSNPGTCPEWIPIKRKTKPGKMYPKMSLKRTNPRIKPASRSVQDVFSAIGPLYHLNLASETKRTSAPAISDIFCASPYARLWRGSRSKGRVGQPWSRAFREMAIRDLFEDNAQVF